MFRILAACVTGVLLSALPAAASTISEFDIAVVTGPYMNIRGTATVDGNAFSVGGSTFTVSQGTVTFSGLIQRAGSAAHGSESRTFVVLGVNSAGGESGANSWAYATVGGGVNNQAKQSASTVGGRLDLSAQGIKWADGTTSTTAATTGGGSVSFATAAVTVSINGATPNGSFSACFSTATITLVGGHPIQVCFSGNAKTTINNTGGWGWNFLVDGNWPTGTSQSATIGVLSLPGTGSGVVSMSACKLIPPQGAGTKSFCQQWTNQGGTLYVPADPPGADIAAADAVFSVVELGN